MSSPHIIPLMAIPSALSQAMATSVMYRKATSKLLENTFVLDGMIGGAITAKPGESFDMYTFDRKRFDFAGAREVFVRIREQRDALQAKLPLLSHVVNLVDYVAHITTNVISMSDRKPRPIADVSKDGHTIAHHNVDSPTYEWSLALYMGISPLPVFGVNIPYNDTSVATQLATFGFGAFTYLYLLSHLDAIQKDRLPSELPYQGFSRPVAAAPVFWQADGSLVLRNA